MNASPRGLLDSLAAPLLGYLFEFLPQTDPLSEWVPGKLLTTEFVLRLRESEFTGFAHAKHGHELQGILIFFKGRLLEAWCFSGSSYETGIDAYQELMSRLSVGGLALYKLPTDAIPAVLALTLGALRISADDAKVVNSPNLMNSLEVDRFGGVLVLEDGHVGQAWLFGRGQLLFPPPLPDNFRHGRLHMVYAPARAPKDLFDALTDQNRNRQQQELERVWAAALAVLTEQLGRGASQTLETQRHRIISDDANEVFAALRRFFETSFEPEAVKDFEKQLTR